MFCYVSAIVTLLRGEEAERVVKEFNGKEMLGTAEVMVTLFPHEAMLCVAHLPMNINDKEFKHMVEPYGAIEKCFLMKNHNTGKFYLLNYFSLVTVAQPRTAHLSHHIN